MSDDDEQPDLTFVETDDLIIELMNRYDHGLFVGKRDHDSGRDLVQHRMKGDPHMIAGMAMDAAHTVIEDFRDGTTPAPE